MLRVPLFTAEALLRNHGMIQYTERAPGLQKDGFSWFIGGDDDLTGALHVL